MVHGCTASHIALLVAEAKVSLISFRIEGPGRTMRPSAVHTWSSMLSSYTKVVAQEEQKDGSAGDVPSPPRSALPTSLILLVGYMHAQPGTRGTRSAEVWERQNTRSRTLEGLGSLAFR